MVSLREVIIQVSCADPGRTRTRGRLRRYGIIASNVPMKSSRLRIEGHRQQFAAF